MNELLKETILLDYNNQNIQELIRLKGWENLDERRKILAVYNFVRDEIAFGYNVDDAIPASRVLAEGYGQCNTKGILLMALARSLGIACRMHGFTIYKPLQRGALRGLYYMLAPSEIVHSWVEVFYDNTWLNLEGFILDMPYLKRLQQKFAGCSGSFCGYGVATRNFQNPSVYWEGGDTYIQKEGIANDFGVFNSPDDFFARHAQKLNPLKKLLFQHWVRHLMNKNIEQIRLGR